MDQPHFQQTEVSLILNSSFQFAHINLGGDEPYHINTHYIILAHFLKLQSFSMDSCIDSPDYNRADILCICMMFSLVHMDTISNIQYMQYIFVMGTTHTEPYQRPQKG